MVTRNKLSELFGFGDSYVFFFVQAAAARSTKKLEKKKTGGGGRTIFITPPPAAAAFFCFCPFLYVGPTANKRGSTIPAGIEQYSLFCC